MSAIMAAKVRGAKTIIGVDRVKSRLGLAREVGATHVIDTTNLPSLAVDLAAKIKEIDPLGSNYCIDTTGVVPIIEAGVAALQPRGEMILIGIVLGKKLDLDLGALMGVSSPRKADLRVLTRKRSAMQSVAASKAMHSRTK